MTAELVGTHPSVTEVAGHIIERSAGNPFYAQEIVREFVERRVIVGERGAYRRQRELAEVRVPATLQATIGARIDRLTAPAKRVLNAAAVIGSRFGTDLLAIVLGDGDESRSSRAGRAGPFRADRPGDVLSANRIRVSPPTRPNRRVPNLSSGLRVHNFTVGLAAAVERRNAAATDENAAVIAAHLEAAGDLREAFGWHMRAGTWFTNRDINAARTAWQRACQLADQLPAGQPGRNSMRIAPRALLCGSAGEPAEQRRCGLRRAARPVRRAPRIKCRWSWAWPGCSGVGRSRSHSGCVAAHLPLLRPGSETISEPTLTVGLLYPVIHANTKPARWQRR